MLCSDSDRENPRSASALAITSPATSTWRPAHALRHSHRPARPLPTALSAIRHSACWNSGLSTTVKLDGTLSQPWCASHPVVRTLPITCEQQTMVMQNRRFTISRGSTAHTGCLLDPSHDAHNGRTRTSIWHIRSQESLFLTREHIRSCAEGWS